MSFVLGRVCLKTRGRDAGKKCVVVDVMDKNFVICTGPPQVTGVARRRVNAAHLKPLDERVDIEKGATDEQVAAALK